MTDETKANITHTTQINTVTGQVHTGSGNISVTGFTSNNTVASRGEFLAALRAFRMELEAARSQGLSEEITVSAATEIEAAEQEATTEKPNLDKIVKRLENAKAVIVAGTGVAVAATAAAAAVAKLTPLIENAIQVAGKIFGI